ncbi:MAG: hypothetical protein HN826_06405 [Methylococcales bacterium]|nr:hypothetical protein [Methylococcales bacterium]
MSLGFWQNAHSENRSIFIKQDLCAGLQGNDKLALIIGNANYALGKLKNPINDAVAVSSSLRRLGFNVIELHDVTHEEMMASVQCFHEKLTENGTGLFYFAGHGMQVEGKNYLIPVQSNISAEYQVKSRAFLMDEIFAAVESKNLKSNIVILDACRDNPFQRSFRSFKKGLAEIQHMSKGSFVAFSAQPGGVASDGSGNNGLFTEQLIQFIEQENITIDQVFNRVSQAVGKASNDRQDPYRLSNLKSDFFFNQSIKEKLVLMPVKGRSLSESAIANYQSTLLTTLSNDYRVFSGQQVMDKIKTITASLSITDCLSSNECITQLANAFNSKFVMAAAVNMSGQESVLKTKKNYQLIVQIKNVTTGEIVLPGKDDCLNCTETNVAETLKRIVLGENKKGSVVISSLIKGTKIKFYDPLKVLVATKILKANQPETLQLLPGNYSITAEKSGYRLQMKNNFRITADQTSTINFDMIPKMGLLTVKITPFEKNTRLFIDGENKGVLLEKDASYKIPFGSRKIELKNKEFKKNIQRYVQIKSVDTIRLSIPLKDEMKDDGIPTWMWVVGGLTVLVLAAAGGGGGGGGDDGGSTSSGTTTSTDSSSSGDGQINLTW